MFAYCGNNPICQTDYAGNMACSATVTVTNFWNPAGWIAAVVFVVEVIVAIVIVAKEADEVTMPQISLEEKDEADVAPGPPPSNNDDDDDDDDDYYKDDSNFAGRQKVGKSKGNTPGNNQKQNKQFKDAAKGFTPEQQRIVHDKITGKGMGFHEIEAIFNELFGPSHR